jgi:hypothetical protein
MLHAYTDFISVVMGAVEAVPSCSTIKKDGKMPAACSPTLLAASWQLNSCNQYIGTRTMYAPSMLHECLSS